MTFTMTTFRNIALSLAFVLVAAFSIGVSQTYAQSCSMPSSSGGVTYTCHGELVSYGGGFSVCYGYITQTEMNVVRPGEYDCDVGGGTGGDSDPAVSITATPGTIERGHASVLRWSSFDVDSCSINNSVGNPTPNTTGSASVMPQNTTTYTITCQSSQGVVSDSATVNVTVPPEPMTAYCSVGPDVAQVGETVHWSSATSVGGFSTSTSLTWKQGASFVTKICSGGQNYASLNRTCPEDVMQGTACTVQGQRCRHSNGCDGQEFTDGEEQPNAHAYYGSVTPYTCTSSSSSTSSSYTYSWSGTDGLSGTTQNVSKAYATTGTKSGQVTITSNTGGSAVATCTMDVVGQTPTATLTANPSSITRGSSSTLTWSSTNASSCTLNESIGSVATGGTRSVSPENTTTYTLVCSAPGSGGGTPGTWQFYGTDISDFACPLTDMNKAYSSLPNCPVSPQGKSCTGSGMCKRNVANGCNINTTLYECVGGSGSSPAQSATASATVTVTDPPSVTCTVDDTTVLPGQEVTYTAHPNSAATGSYTWNSTQGGSYGTAVTAKRTFSAEGLYDMRVKRANTSYASCPNVSVSACPGPRTASIEASAERVNSGDQVTLEWEASGVYTSCTISGPGGTITTTTASSCTVPGGTETVTVTGQSTYTISCDSGAITDSVIVNVIPGFEEF